jgi:methionyl-tRNA synthetase
MKEKYYVTTTIPYANAAPHIGHALEFVQADVLARWNRLLGKDVFFLTGTDEHGTKNFQTAKNHNKDPLDFVTQNANLFKELLKKLNASNDNFIRTTDRKEHWPGVLKMWKKLEKKGDIYKKKYEGNYCNGCERFVTEKDLIDGKCPNHPNLEIEKIAEENYFFKLSKYSEKIKELIVSNKLEIVPEKWKNNFLGLVKEGLTDVSFSRDVEHLPWGVPVPNDKNQVMYVWCDALTNYLTGIGYPDKKYKDYWPADVHVVGKDMLRFHTGIWPGMLLSAEIPLPKKVIVHGFLTINGQKMSKSTGNVVNPLEIVTKYGADSLRYYFMRNNVFGEDGDFDEKALIDRHNNELLNKLGNLISRIAGLIENNGFEKCEVSLKIDFDKIKKLIDNFEFDKALNEIFAFIDVCNEYVQNKKPWETKDKSVLYELANAIKQITILLYPFIPGTCEKIAGQFDFEISIEEFYKPLSDSSNIHKGEHIFLRIEVNEKEQEQKINKELIVKEVMEGIGTIAFDDWSKVDLRVAQVKEVEDIEGADKLLKLTLDVGELGERIICAGIKKYYSFEELKEKHIIIVANLASRKMKGIESKGMLLAAGNPKDDVCILLTPDKKTKPGTKIG